MKVKPARNRFIRIFYELKISQIVSSDLTRRPITIKIMALTKKMYFKTRILPKEVIPIILKSIPP